MNESEAEVVFTEAEIKRQKRLAKYRKYYASHKAKAKAYYQNNKARLAELGSKWRKENPERCLLNRRRQYANNRKARIASSLKYQRENADERRKYIAQWRAANKEHLRKYYARKRQTPEGKLEAIQAAHKRTALKNKSEVRATKTDIKNFLSSATKCHYCGRDDVPMTVDHFIALSRGGPHAVENFVAACKPCNSRKKDRDPYEFMKSLQS